MMTHHLLTLNHVHLILDHKKLLKDITFSISAGDFITIVGPNGAGKSTLLKVIVGLIKPSAGAVKMARGLRLGYMPQRLQLNEMMPLDVQTFLNTVAYDPEVYHHTVAQTQIYGLLKASMHELSGGEFQRVLFARALLTDPDLLILDEPEQGLDVHGQDQFYHLLDQVRRKKDKAIIMVSHDLHFVHQASDYVICLNQHICCMGKPQEVKDSREYQTLFGQPLSEQLVPYVHIHDHTHDHISDEGPHDRACQDQAAGQTDNA
jgi:zinc transport system ATP-binding protein